MIRLTKQADYAVMLLATIAKNPQRLLFSAGELAQRTRIPTPTVQKVLKQLARGGVLLSQRGSNGGYHLAQLPREVELLDVIDVMEGPVALTECIEDSPGHCDLETSCLVRGAWQVINERVRMALMGVTLASILEPIQEAAGDVTCGRPLAPTEETI